MEEMNLHRSISMPVQPKYIERKPLERSNEMEMVNDPSDYYPESPKLPTRTGSKPNGELGQPQHSQSCNNFSNNWSGSTIELNGSEQMETDFNSLKKRPHRVIEKNGRENVLFRRIPERSWRYMRDLVTTLVSNILQSLLPKRYITPLKAPQPSSSLTKQGKADETSNATANSDSLKSTASDHAARNELPIELDWKYVLGMFLGSYFFSWFFFAILCYVVAYAHGDLLVDNNAVGKHLGDGRDPCIVGVTNFRAMLIYSVETQTTIGFGEKYPSEECPETIFLFIMQIICSIAIEGAMVSVIYLKTARPAKQMTKLKFSDKAVVCYRDGKLCLLFRVCDLRKQQTIESKIRVYIVVDRNTQEGEIVKSHTELKLEGNGQQIIEWPEIVCHIIDDCSPLREFTKSAKMLNASQFELYVSIVGTSSSSAQVTEARTSYIPGEIFWGQSFVNIITYDGANERYMIDYRNFNTTMSVDMERVKDE